ncbi:GntR family transcriptional regulator [Polymorphum gilvum]|uniref:GntR-family transcriptional regulator n=1 Tax=Polymorphum gilvum (strain LMG 25793 / CGMCC 1.9160 / SL003B-26A1) TaxID=991905 RepID=F2J2K2_POLGS|nr:GntR family transcriptional regulator [Polymorphum gilvum]ADZ70916.1 GntR-family transcriptional regulator [Polymorphum gilvum SL003B-26A1]
MKIELDLETLTEDPASRRQASFGNRVYRTLKQAIVQLQLRPGNSLSEADVARKLGVSRQPVREAFIKLADVGLVQVRPQRGTFVELISRKEVENARFIREAIEVALVRKAALEASPASIDAFKGLLRRQEAAAAAGQHSEFLQLDERFHEAIADSVDCRRAWLVVEDLKVQMDRVRFLSLPAATPMATLVAQHADIVAAIEAHDPDAAAAAMSGHLREILTSLPRIAEDFSDLFDD